MHPDIVEILFTEQQIAKRVAELGAQLTYEYDGIQPLLVSILKGSFIFMADLSRNILLDCDVEFMSVSSYGKGTKTSGAVKILKDLDVDIAGRDIIIIEDILDSGMTLSYLRDILVTRGARSLKLCTLLDKPERRTADVRADYIGFTIPDRFIVGYGLDYAEKYRNLPYIGVISPDKI